ncbi:MAG TPA: biotin/lipoyl-containing protein [Vicinamibacteria bacterium]|nr:biotin/lipoyl-containing protein [Vicinamibacteria bacterium]
MMRLVCGQEHREVELQSSSGGFRVRVAGQAFAPTIEELGPGTYFYRENGQAHVFHCVREGDVIHLFWRGSVYRVEVAASAGRAAPRHPSGGLESPMPGKVIAVKVVPGQAVVKGEELLLVEAMKMENAIRAPRDGVVVSVAARVGDMVAPGVVLVELQ